MSKLIGLTVLAVLIGTTVVAGPRLTGSDRRAAPPSIQSSAFSPDTMHLKTGSLPDQKVDDKSFVFTDSD